MIIYKITNKFTGEMYIGQTRRSLLTRWKAHCAASNRPSYGKLLKAIKEYGRECFTVEQIDVATTKEEANEKEVYWIAYYDATNKGYNTSPGGKAGGNRKRVMAVEDGLVFDTMIDAGKHYGRSSSVIGRVLDKPHLTSAGQHWVSV